MAQPGTIHDIDGSDEAKMPGNPARRYQRRSTNDLELIHIEQVEYHRNGIAGEPFYAVLFRSEGPMGRCLATVFPPQKKADGEPDWDQELGPHNPRVAVVSLDKIPEHGVTFGFNSWRGDRYAGPLYDAIQEQLADEHAELDRRLGVER